MGPCPHIARRQFKTPYIRRSLLEKTGSIFGKSSLKFLFIASRMSSGLSSLCLYTYLYLRLRQSWAFSPCPRLPWTPRILPCKPLHQPRLRRKTEIRSENEAFSVLFLYFKYNSIHCLFVHTHQQRETERNGTNTTCVARAYLHPWPC